MAHTGISGAEAKRRVRIAQFAGVGLAVLAVTLWYLEVPGLAGPQPQKPDAPVTATEKPTVAAVSPKVDAEAVSGIGERLDLGANRPPVVATVPPSPEEQPKAAPSGTQWKYLGAIRESSRMMALVSIEGTQKILSEGAKVALKTPAAEGRPENVDYRATVLAIAPEHIDIEEDGGQKRRIDLEARSTRVSWVKNMPTTVATASAHNAGAGMSPEARQRLVTSGIDLAQAERARLAAQLAGRSIAVPAGNPAAVTGAAANINVKGGGVLNADGTVTDPTAAKGDVDGAAAATKSRKRNAASETVN